MTTATTTTERATWLDSRRSGIGSSDAAAILGVNPWKSAFQVWSEKVGLAEPDDVSNKAAVRAGIALEPVVADLYSEETGRALLDHGRYAVRRHPTHSFMLATIDREIVGDKPGVLECKATDLADPWEDGAPLWAQVQLAHQLVVLGMTWGSVAALIRRNRFTYADIELSARVGETLIREEERFWKMVETQTPPPADGSEATADALRRLYPSATPGKIVTLPADFAAVEADLMEAKEKCAEWEERKRAAENRIRLAIGDAEAATIPGGGSFTFKSQTRAAYTKSFPESTYRVLRHKESA